MKSRLFAGLMDALESGRAPKLRRSGWRLLYGALGHFWRDRDWSFMNYGYLPGPEQTPGALLPRDEPDRPFIGIYDHVARGLPITGARVLEVGCGRGGGADYVARYFTPERIIGADFSKPALARAEKVFSDTSNLAFEFGDAERLPFADASFDVVLNVESSHCYGDIDAFVREADRVLKPGGWFGWADMRSCAAEEATDAALAQTGLALVRRATLNDGVIRALDAAHDRKAARIAGLKIMRRFMGEFAGTRGSTLYRALKSGSVIYMSRRYRKPD